MSNFERGTHRTLDSDLDPDLYRIVQPNPVLETNILGVFNSEERILFPDFLMRIAHFYQGKAGTDEYPRSNEIRLSFWNLVNAGKLVLEGDRTIGLPLPSNKIAK